MKRNELNKLRKGSYCSRPKHKGRKLINRRTRKRLKEYSRKYEEQGLQ